MKSILITGCNRGIGLGLVKRLVKEQNPPKAVIATCRSIEKAEELKSLADQNKFLHLLELDVKNFEKYDEFAKKVGQIVNEEGLNVLVNNAGVSSKFTRIQLVKPDQLIDNYTINTVAPVILSKALLPLLKKAAKNNASQPLGAGRALILNISSILGSISTNTDGGLYPYKCSKAALNMATKSMSVDLFKDGIMATCVHPGWVKTDMGGAKAPMEVEASTESLIKLISSLNESHNGGFFQFDGSKLSW